MREIRFLLTDADIVEHGEELAAGKLTVLGLRFTVTSAVPLEPGTWAAYGRLEPEEDPG